MCGRVGLKSGQRAWDVSSKSGLVSSAQKRPALCWAAAKPDKQAHHSAARLSLLPLPHAARQQTVCRPTRTLITFSPRAAVLTWHGYRCVRCSEGQKRTARPPRMAQHHCSVGLGIVKETRYRYRWLDFDNGSRTSLAITSFFSCMPRDSELPALLNLRTTGMLHAYWLNESNEIHPSVVEM